MNKPPLKKEIRGDIEDGVQILSPVKETLKVKGKLSYSEGDQAWSTLRLKKEILQKFPHLKEKQGSFVYLMAYYNSYDELKEEIKVFEKQKDKIPLVFFIGRENITSISKDP